MSVLALLIVVLVV